MHPPTRKTIFILLVIVGFMFSFSFAMAPLYNALCRATGFGGKITLIPYVTKNNAAPDLSRSVIVQFVATNNASLPWDFRPQKTSIEIHPEEETQVMFWVRNNTNKTMTVQAIPSITPWSAVKHLHKIECFCFQKQTLAGGEGLDMPVVFRIDKQLPSDIHVITLAYTLFDVTSSQKRIAQ